MLSARIEGHTRELATGQDEFRNLCIRDQLVPLEVAGVTHQVNTMVSAWEPTPQQLAVLNAGGKVMLSIMGMQHPPVCLWVE